MRNRDETLAWPGLVQLDRMRERSLLGQRQIALLRQIAATGSITQAARAVQLSYKAAWDAVATMNNMAEQPLIISTPGGKRGGGSQLTEYGTRQIQLYDIMESEYQRFISRLNEKVHNVDELVNFMRRLMMQTSARNQFLGRVTSLNIGPINAEVVLDIGGGNDLAAVITHDSAQQLGLAVGSEAYALIKAPWVIVTTDTSLRTSARNCLSGTVVRCVQGAINSEVVIELAGGKLVAATVTNESIDELGLTEGKRASALIKASHVILAVPN